MFLYLKTRPSIVSLFRHNHTIKPKLYLYQSTVNKSNNSDFYVKLVKKLRNYESFKTHTNIEILKNKKLENIYYKDIVRHYGKFINKIYNRELPKIKVVIYKKKIGPYKVKIEFHFLNNKLFFCAKTFSCLNSSEKQEILKVIEDKYLNKKSVDLKNKFICDENECTIFINDRMEFSLFYLYKDESVINKLLEYIKMKKIQKTKKIQKNQESLYHNL